MPKYGAHTFLWIDEWTTEKGNQAIAATGNLGRQVALMLAQRGQV